MDEITFDLDLQILLYRTGTEEEDRYEKNIINPRNIHYPWRLCEYKSVTSVR